MSCVCSVHAQSWTSSCRNVIQNQQGVEGWLGWAHHHGDPVQIPQVHDPRPPCHHVWSRYKDLNTDFMQLSDAACHKAEWVSELPTTDQMQFSCLGMKQNYIYLMSRPYCKYIDTDIIDRDKYRHRCGRRYRQRYTYKYRSKGTCTKILSKDFTPHCILTVYQCSCGSWWKASPDKRKIFKISYWLHQFCLKNLHFPDRKSVV